jgi:imidazolonepropionase-like amidohydrolase
MGLQIRARYAWDGESGWAERPVTVAVEGDRIAAVRRDGRSTPDDPGAVLDFGDATVLPGLIDMHTHLGINHRTGDIKAQMRHSAVEYILAGTRSLREDLASGVTTAKLNGDRDFFDVQMRQAIQDGMAEGPRLYVSGRGIKTSRCTGGVVATCLADDHEAVWRCVDENIRSCVDWIKLFASGSLFGTLAEVLQPFFGSAEISVAVNVAHAAEKRVSVHCFGGEAADACVQAGVDVVEHGWLLTERQLQAMAKLGIWLCPTASVLTHPEGVLSHLPPGPGREEAKRRVDQVCDVMRMALRLGVPLLVGTDALHGCLAYEMKLLQGLGGAPERLLAAATWNAARVLGQGERIGALRAGAQADLVVVRGNALADVACLADVLLVVQSGRVVAQESNRGTNQ